jgi:hypothetical protein
MILAFHVYALENKTYLLCQYNDMNTILILNAIALDKGILTPAKLISNNNTYIKLL